MAQSDKYDNVIRFDWAAKYMLRDKADFDILESLVSTIIGEPVHITQLLESESNRQHKNDKANRVDIKALDSLGEIIIVEIQFAEDLNFLQRIVYSTAKTITEHIQIGQDYQNVKKVFSINILYYNLGYGEDYLYHGQSELLGVHTGDKLILENKKTPPGLRPIAINNIFPEYYVIRASQFDETKEPANAEQEWMRYLKTGYIDPNTKVPGLKKALERLKITQMTEQELKEYKDYQFNQRFEENVILAARYRGEQEGLEKGFESGHKIGLEVGLEEGRAEGRKEGLEEGLEEGRKEGRKEGLEEGRKEGLEEGREEEKRAIALKMKNIGLDPAVISEITGIVYEE